MNLYNYSQNSQAVCTCAKISKEFWINLSPRMIWMYITSFIEEMDDYFMMNLLSNIILSYFSWLVLVHLLWYPYTCTCWILIKKSDFKFSTIFSRNSTFKKYHVNVHVNHMHVFLSVTWYYRFSDEAGDDDIPITSCLQKSLGVGGGGGTT